MKYGLGVDIGGTKIATVIINEQGNVVERVEVPSNTVDKEQMFMQVVNSIEQVLANATLHISMIEGMGIGVPGKVDREKGVAVFQNNLPWRNFPIVERLRDYFSIENIVIDNDVYMAAFAEWKISNVSEDATFVYVTVSTGISCSIIQQGSFVRGAGFAGEIGLFPVLSKSSKKGVQTLEETASGPSIERRAQKDLKQPYLKTGDLFQAYENGNENAQSVMNEVVESLAHGIYSIICLLDPHKIIFGGGVMNHHPYLLDLVREKVSHYVISEQKHALARMQRSKLKGDSGIVGAGLKGMGGSNLLLQS
ncbi:glucokinase [Virgibacillus halotolerans]|uniref:ROK family protein n=1 Tax=Virgibacillus halotolerans TaxID=1071053 RepID=UPI001961BC36|nr:ROK family protein [Virgibacillus halotolerans]MBM7600027.1 glucokinase [Virgibacillus halotolerans]